VYTKNQINAPKKGERKKQDILDAAAQLFFTKGYTATTIQDILDMLGCSKGCFYHHFESKLDVLTGIAQQHALLSRASYTALKPRDSLAAMNLLLHYASPLRLDETGLLQSLAALADHQEGAVLQDALHEAVFTAFYRDFKVTALELEQEEKAGFRNADELSLAFYSFLSGCTLLIREAIRMPVCESASRGIPMLRALRRHMEGSLGMMAGTISITQSAELLELLGNISRC
jgi:AcrR family transcriptional regulator